MDDLFELFEEDDVIFHHILSKLYDNFNKDKTNQIKDLEDAFGEGISDYVFRLLDKEYITPVKTTYKDANKNIVFNFLDINDEGIEALKTIYNPETAKKNIKQVKQKKSEEKQEKQDTKKHRENVFRWIKIGIIISGIFSFVAIIISILAFLRE